ncbi:hypothetical protein WIS52_20410 [Pseudonocardia nematodicida]|uniref:Chromosome segregation ATPase n=1 Tax=Pseudonocardia nematodicida TaxID=1206997 RepID=A0ABV1KEE3_9PSEU
MSEQPFTDEPVANDAAAARSDGGDGVVMDVTGPSRPGPSWAARRGPELERCQFPGGCAHTMEYAGSGRRPKYCYQVVGGVMHDRSNAKRIADGATPARRRGETDDAQARPIARAGQTVTDQVAALTAFLEERTGDLREALVTLADPDAVAAEIAAAQRAARAQVDQAQAATDDARAQARTAQTAAEAARRSAAASDDEAAEAVYARAAAEQARDEALAAREQAETQLAQLSTDLEEQSGELDTARAETDRVTTELAAARAELEEATAARDTARAERDTATGDRDQVAAELAAATRDHTRAHTELTEARARVEALATDRDTATADLAGLRRDLDRAETDRARLADDLDAAREQAAEHRAARAGAESTLTALRAQLTHDVDRERAYGHQRLDDAELRHAAQLADLRAELDRLRGQAAGHSPMPDRAPAEDGEPDSDVPATDPTRTAAARRARPRAARRRPGPDSPDDTTDEQEQDL